MVIPAPEYLMADFIVLYIHKFPKEIYHGIYRFFLRKSQGNSVLFASVTPGTSSHNKNCKCLIYNGRSQVLFWQLLISWWPKSFQIQRNLMLFWHPAVCLNLKSKF